MRLLKVKLTNFRRFADETCLDVSERLIALVGPNEVGKSSVLDAIEMLGRRRPPKPKDATRTSQDPAKVAGLYVLDDDDRSSLAGIHGGQRVTHCWVELASTRDNSVWTVDPRPARDLAPRRRCNRFIRALAKDPELDHDMVDDVLEILESEADSLSDGQLNSLQAFPARLRNLGLPEEDEGWTPDQVTRLRERRAVAAAELASLAELEREPAPAIRVINALAKRLPAAAFFRLSDRELESEYDVDEAVSDPPPALENLLALAELDLGEVKKELDNARRPRVEKLIENANRTLKDQFGEAWSQSTVYPRLSPPHDGTLRIFVATEGEEDYSDLGERSDGLRWFLALRAFLGSWQLMKPILLVDEAETHLHYDAQADLVYVLMNQKLVSKVVYTTHSVGCLPPDLGCGIRAVVPERDAERSRIENSYWSISAASDERAGHSALLFAMGASLLAWTVPKYAVVAEGPSDAILLPTLLREASGLDVLPYRVVPGLSEVPEERMSSLSRQAASTVFLTDGDAGGLALQARLKANGVDPRRLFDLGSVRKGAALEDLVSETIFVQAINVEIESWGHGAAIRPEEVPTVGRWKTLCGKGTRLEGLNKSRVAQRIVDLARSEDPTKPQHKVIGRRLRGRMAKLHQDLQTQLDVPGGNLDASGSPLR